MAYATVDDLVVRWRPLTIPERARAATLLEDAAVRIDAVKPLPDPPSDIEARKIVSCEMVKRAMLTPVDLPAATQTQQTAGIFQQGITYANPAGDLYLTKADRSLLGISRMRASTVSGILPRPPHCWDTWAGPAI